jgi:predicted signal transduction protein with EAL and GGDEF domain
MEGARIGVSIGIAVHQPQDDTGPDALLCDADAAMYRAKQSGKNRVCWAAEPGAEELAPVPQSAAAVTADGGHTSRYLRQRR